MYKVKQRLNMIRHIRINFDVSEQKYTTEVYERSLQHLQPTFKVVFSEINKSDELENSNLTYCYFALELYSICDQWSKTNLKDTTNIEQQTRLFWSIWTFLFHSIFVSCRSTYSTESVGWIWKQWCTWWCQETIILIGTKYVEVGDGNGIVLIYHWKIELKY